MNADDSGISSWLGVIGNIGSQAAQIYRSTKDDNQNLQDNVARGTTNARTQADNQKLLIYGGIGLAATLVVVFVITRTGK